MQTDLLRQSYDQIAKEYLANRARLRSAKYVNQLLKYLPKRSTILDVGCGAGVPVDDILLKAGHHVVGIDISPEQIKLARRNCPGGEYSVRDMQMLTPGEYEVQAIVSFYALFHVPRAMHGQLLKTMASYVPMGGLLLATMGDREFEGEHVLHGARLWSSQYGTAKNSKLVEAAGFTILLNEIDASGGERHQVILAQKQYVVSD
jgi:cyclopropane fatty-acyl-phospholipid synthase-like methyltransferase